MVEVTWPKIIILCTLTSSPLAKAFSAQTLPQILVTSARRLAPSETSSSSASSSSSLPASKSSFVREQALSSEEISEDYDTHPQYSFSYSVKDLSTGDDKQQEETRDGANVQGKYSFLEPDGIQRTVEYSSDNTNGFNAIVSRKTNAAGVQQSAHEPSQILISNLESSLQLPKAQQSSATVSQSEQRLTRTEAIALARGFPATVLGQRVPTTIVDHPPRLFVPDSETPVLTQNGERNLAAIRNAGKTVIQRIQHPRTIIEHRPATTYITQLAPAHRTLSLLHDTYN